MDEGRNGGMQSGWPGEWPRPEEGGTGPSGPAEAGGASSPATEWPDRSQQAAPAPPQAEGRRSPKGAAAAVGLVLAGALAGGLGIAAVQHGSGATTTASAAQGFAPGAGNGQGQLGQGQQGFPGGAFGGRDDAEQRFVGTLTAVSGSSVTVRTQSGTTTYQVGSGTQVLKDGQAASVSDLAAGDQVLMHVIGGGSSPTVERIIAGQNPSGGFGFPGGPGGDREGDGQGPGSGAGTGTAGTGGTTTGLRT